MSTTVAVRFAMILTLQAFVSRTEVLQKIVIGLTHKVSFSVTKKMINCEESPGLKLLTD